MKLSLSVIPASNTHTLDIADLQINEPTLGSTANKIQLDVVRDRCQTAASGISLDFLLLASVVYCSDKMVNRAKYASDAWTRRMDLTIPVSDPAVWKTVTNDLKDAVSFLTGDYWEFTFSRLTGPLYRARTMPAGHPLQPGKKVVGDVVCLFSGGLDSFIGAIDWLEDNPNGTLLAVGHHDRHVKGPYGDQNTLLDLLKAAYPNRVDAFQVQVGQSPKGEETSFRSRSLLFLALGVHAAQALGPNVPLIVPENGTIAINIPLTPSRRGSCSTRTTHPFFLNRIEQMLKKIGIQNPIQNPLALKTKGECVVQCRNQTLLANAADQTVSCAKTGHTSTWRRRTVNGCGRCVPCMFRRASLHAGNLDTEEYGLDVCNSAEVPITNPGAVANDLRAVASFLRARHTAASIERVLHTSGGLTMPEVQAYAQVVFRAMNEVDTWLRAKGDATVKSWL